MSIDVTVKPAIAAVVELKARKSLDGDIMIFDHPEIDIIVSSKKNKVLALSKEQYGDHVYATQSRFFEFLSKKGIIDTATIRGGNVYGSLEGVLLESLDPEQSDPVQSAIYSIAKFFHEEAPYYQSVQRYEMEIEQELLEPDDEDTTELGKVPHEKRKGNNTDYAGHNAAYGLYGIYEE
jgi:hypothetical protein